MEEAFNCLICASVSSPQSLPAINGEGERVSIKTEVLEQNDEETEFFEKWKPNFLPFFGELRGVQENLKTFFILRKVLKIPEETICELLKQEDELNRFEKLVNVCSPCGESVQSFYDTIKEICKLERKLIRIEKELKGKIRESRFCTDGNPVWKQIREEVLRNDDYDGEDFFDPEISEEILVDFDAKDFKSEPEPIDIICELESFSPEFEIDEQYKFMSEPLNFNRNEREDDSSSSSSSSSSSTSSSWSSSSSSSSSSSPPPKRTALKLPPFKRKPPQLLPSPPSSASTSSISIHMNKNNQKYKYKNAGKLPIYKSVSNPDFISFLVGSQRFFQCRKCPAEACILDKIMDHVQVHKKGAGDAISCESCGWYMLLKDYESHKSLRHRFSKRKNSKLNLKENYYISHSSQ